MPIWNIVHAGQRNGGGLATFLFGSCAGFFLATTLSISFRVFSNMDNGQIDPQITSTALRTLSAIRHFPETHGWGLIHVFHGVNDPNVLVSDEPSEVDAQPTKWLGDSQQGTLISRLLDGKRDGYFVDLASIDSIKISNTFALENRFGWKGICVEPNHQYWESMSYRKCDVVGAGVGDTSSSGGQEFGNRNASQTALEDRLRYTVTLREILHRFNAPKIIDYLSMAVESIDELSALIEFPFARYRFNIINVEQSSPLLERILEENGYLELKQDDYAGDGYLWMHQSAQHRVNVSALIK